MKHFIKATEPMFQDITHPDGSKSYQRIYGDYITLDRPEVVQFVDEILTKNFTGWGYMPTLDKARHDGKITDNEYQKIMMILD